VSHAKAVKKLVGAVEPHAELAPLVAAVEGLAALLDANPEDPAVWREYRFMLRDLMGHVGGGVGDDLEQEFAALS